MNTETETPPAAGVAADGTEQDTEALRSELATLKDRYLRLAADFENFRRRTLQEVDRRAAAQKEAFIRDLLPVIDNLERAMTANAGAPEQFRQGVQMTLQQFHQLLRRHGIEPEESSGEPFDPNRHQALSVRHDPTKQDGTVLEVVERGYRRGDELFRPAKVVVNELNSSEAAGPQPH